MAKKVPEDIQVLLKSVVDRCEKEDTSVRETQIRTWRKLKLLWEGFTNVYWDSVAHDWRVYNQQYENNDNGNSDQDAYDRPMNVFRAYLESIIAALSVLVPSLKCYPDDAENTLDLATARAGDKITQLVYKHNDIPLVWLHALFVMVTENATFCYSYPASSEEYGSYETENYVDEEQEHEISKCPLCGYEISSENVTGQPVPPEEPINPEQPGMEGINPEQMGAEPPQELDPNLESDQLDKFGVDDIDAPIDDILLNKGDVCPNCQKMMEPVIHRDKFTVPRLTGKTKHPKTRICLEVKGGLNVKIPNYARTQAECPYLIDSYETNYVNIVQEYDHLHGNEKLAKCIRDRATGEAGSYNEYGQWGRVNPQYQSEYPENVITKKCVWLRPAAFNFLDKEEADQLKKIFPDGCKVVYANEEFAEACNQKLDDYWTISYNPLADYLHSNPLGLMLTSTQEITGDLVSLVLQTIEHGINQTFVDPKVVDLNGYSQMETTPGGLYPATPRSGKSIGDGFHELKAATLSSEVMPFFQQMQSLGQIVSGALPSIFGGAVEGSGTASEYSMSRAQAQQRLQTNWKTFTIWWKNVFSKVVTLYIKEVQYDERSVERKDDGSFINVFIKRAELEGRIGRIELEANENLPISWTQRNDILLKLMQNANPEVMSILNAPENLPAIHEALGLPDFFMPGEDDVIRQYDEIKQLLNTEPIQTGELDPETQEMGELPSVEIDPIYDNHQIQFEICRKWIISEAGAQAKIENPEGYKNVLLHGRMHYEMVQQAAMMQAAQGAGAGPDNTPGKKPKETEQEAPIMGEGDVVTK